MGNGCSSDLAVRDDVDLSLAITQKMGKNSFTPVRSLRTRGKKVLSPREALDILMEGNGRFVRGESAHPHQDKTWIHDLAKKQNPIVAILCCADSRVPPEMLFDEGFGDMFVCRVAGNIASTLEIASLEYAVCDLGVKVILVLGHEYCGAVKAAINGGVYPGYIDALLDNIAIPLERVSHREPAEGWPDYTVRIAEVVKENARYQLQRVLKSSVILQAVQKNQLLVVPAYYDLEQRTVELLEVDA